MNTFKLALVALCSCLIVGCTAQSHNTKESSPFSIDDKPPVKNVIMLVGDGMGPQQVGLLLTYARLAKSPSLIERSTAFDRLINNGGSLGISLTHPGTGLVVDSAASATQLASGQISGSEMIGSTVDGDPTRTIVEVAKQYGKSTGLISDIRITHATPAAFAAHQPHRSLESRIATDLLSIEPDVMLSGGLQYWLPQTVNTSVQLKQHFSTMTQGSVKIESKRKDDRDLLNEASERGYDLAFNKTQLDAVDGKVLGLFAHSSMATHFDESISEKVTRAPTLSEMTAHGLDILSKDPEGFFLMVEAGQIDKAGHRNDAGWMLHEMLKLNETLEVILQFIDNNPDTLLVVTGDHETGGFGFSYHASDIPESRSLDGSLFDERAFAPNYNFVETDVLDQLYRQKTNFNAMLAEFDMKPMEEQTPERLVEIVNRNSEVKLSYEAAEDVLKLEPNTIKIEEHYSLGENYVPVMGAKSPFFVYQQENRSNLLGRYLGLQQGIVWATGTHTDTPVLVFSSGPAHWTSKLDGIVHHTQIGKAIIDAISSNN